jgi:dUTP pyrophosphatase
LIWPVWEQKFNKRATSNIYSLISTDAGTNEPTVESLEGSVPVKIYRIDKEIELPAYATSGAVAVDLRARTSATIRPRDMAVVPCNIVVEIPDGYGILLLPRSGLAANYSVTLANSPGLVDSDYCGPEDEIKALVINHCSSPKTLEVKKGDRICQMMVLPIPKMQIVEIPEPPAGKSRGGLGSTGVS